MEICDLYKSGVTFDEFVNMDTDTYKEKTLEIFNSIEFDDELTSKIKAIDTKVKILVCGEMWCPDCMINVPVLEKMKGYNDNIDISIVGKEGNEEFFKKYTSDENVRIPTFVIYDNDYNELGSFVEHPKKIKEIMETANQPNRIVAMRKYRKGEYAQDTLRDILEIIL
ncbi:thioredoxin family protein [Dethiothermospora halolimnae]|uniref:thioredoxin family protein n=1 Tax=Dethiothermospora halolimnae TaxID=3114390 RepID=UPI003CCB993D